MTVIPAQEIKIDPSSYIDSGGRVFFWNGRVFRGISNAHAPFVKDLLANPIMVNLQNRDLLIRTWIPQEHADGFEMILEHERIEFPSYCMEWTPQMLKDAALLTLNVGLELSDYDLTLQDAYPWNIFFNGARPIFIDFGSIVPVRSDALWAPYDQFCNFFLYPLYLYSAGLYDVARRFLFDYLSGLPADQFFRLAPLSLKVRYPFPYARHASNHHLAHMVRRLKLEDKMREFIKRSYQNKKADVERGRKRFLASLLKEVEAIKMPQVRSRWRTYYADKREMCSYTEQDFAKKEKIVYDILRTYQPSSVFDAGCNTGIYSLLAAKNGARVIAVDTDEPSVSELYRNAKQGKEKILPLVLDVLNPTPAFGWRAKQFPSAIERFQADMVFAFALIHHLAITGRQGFKRALDSLDAFSKKYVLIEFVDKDDPKVKQLMTHSLQVYPWYSFEEFKRVITARYKKITFFEPHSLTRRFILYEKK